MNKFSHDVDKWLFLIGLERYTPHFHEYGLTDRQLIEQLVVADLDAMSITTESHRKKLLRFSKSMTELEGNLKSPRAEVTQEKSNLLKERMKKANEATLNKVRGKVSADRTRLRRDSVDLDLTYITTNLIGNDPTRFPKSGSPSKP